MFLTKKYNLSQEKHQFKANFGEWNATLITLKKYEVLFLLWLCCSGQGRAMTPYFCTIMRRYPKRITQSYILQHNRIMHHSIHVKCLNKIWASKRQIQTKVWNNPGSVSKYCKIQSFPKMILLGHFVFLFNTVNVIFEEKCDNWNDSGWQTRVYWKTVRFILAALANEHRKSGTSSKSTTSKCRTSAASPYNYI